MNQNQKQTLERRMTLDSSTAASDQTKVSALAAVYAKIDGGYGDYPTPQQWLHSKQARRLINAIELGMSAKKKIEDVYNHPDLEYAYEAHLNPFFMLQMIRTYRWPRGFSAPRC